MTANLVQLDFAAPNTAAPPAIATAAPSPVPFTSFLLKAAGADVPAPRSPCAAADPAAAQRKTSASGVATSADLRLPSPAKPDRTAPGTYTDTTPMLAGAALALFSAMPVQTSSPATVQQTHSALAAGGSAGPISVSEHAPVLANLMEPASAAQFAWAGSSPVAPAAAVDAGSAPSADVTPALATPAPDSTVVPAGSTAADPNVPSTAPNCSAPKPETATLADPANGPGLDAQPTPLTQTTQPVLPTENEIQSAASNIPAGESAARFSAMPAKPQFGLGNSGIRNAPLASAPAPQKPPNVTPAAEPITVTNPGSRTGTQDHPGLSQACVPMGLQDPGPSQVAPAGGKFAESSSSGEAHSETHLHGSESSRVSSVGGNQDDSSLNASPRGNPDPKLVAADPNPQSTASQLANAPAPGSLGNVLSPETQEPQNPAPTTVERPGLPAAENAATQPVSTGPVQLARMVNGVSQAEMHIGLRTQAFGGVEVHTVVRESQLGITVGSEKGNLRSFLNSEVPVLQTTFRQHDLRLENVRFLENRAGVGADLSGGANQQPRPFRQSSASTATGWPPEDGQDSPPEDSISSEGSTKLSVLA